MLRVKFLFFVRDIHGRERREREGIDKWEDRKQERRNRRVGGEEKVDASPHRVVIQEAKQDVKLAQLSEFFYCSGTI